MRKRLKILPVLFTVFFISSCMHKNAEDESSYHASPTVKATHITIGTISREVTMNATARYLKTSVISSPVNGYVLHTYIEQGHIAGFNQVLFTIQTREARALGDERNIINDGTGFRGIDTIRSNTEGYVVETFHETGDFVTTGEKLLTMKEISSLVFVLDLPYEWNKMVSRGMKVSLVFPDKEKVQGIITQISPEVDPVNQTQKVIITVSDPGKYPEGVIAVVKIPVAVHHGAMLLPEKAVLTNETESAYWVMKMINDSTAVKVPVQTGIIHPDTVEITSPEFSKSDRILVYGNYAVPDTVQVTLTDSLK